MPNFVRRYFFGFLSWTFVYFIHEVPYSTKLSSKSWRHAIWSKSETGQKARSDCLISYLHYSTFSNGTSRLTSAWTCTFTFWQTLRPLVVGNGVGKSCQKKAHERNELRWMLCLTIGPFLFRLCLLSNSYNKFFQTIKHRYRSGSVRHVCIINRFF